MNIKIDGSNYILDIQAAIKAGVLKKEKKMRPIKASDVPNGSLVRYCYRGVYNWYEFVMIDNKIKGDGQLICNHGDDKGQPGYLLFIDEGNYLYEYYDYSTRTWIREVEDN
ncbi:MAG: hypothetical protein EKK57_07200 [Proteobacteria bacterium]|nr:MAG: hypothetical protein EKK57_07200 [Pseudomonadota bacterium]